MINNQVSLQNKLNLAMQHMHQGQYQQALVLFSLIEDSGMKDFRLFLAIGSAYQRLKDDIKALIYFKKSLTINSEQAELQYTVGKIYKNNGDLAKATFHAELAIKLEPNNGSYKQELGFIRLMNKDFKGALSIFLKQIDLKSNRTLALLGCGRAYAGLGNDIERSKYVDLAGIADPNHPSVINDKAWLLKEQGEYLESKRYFEKYLKVRPSNDEGYENLALIELQLKNPQGALDIIDTGLSRLPSSRLLHKFKSSLSFEMGQENYLGNYQQITRNKMPINLHTDFIQALVKSGNFTSAEVEFDWLVKKAPPSINLHALWMSIQEKQQNYEVILDFYQKLDTELKRLPNSVLEILTRTYFALGSFKLSRDTVSELVLREPNNQYFWALYTTSLRLLGDEHYHELCNFSEYVQSRELILPNRFTCIEDFNSELKVALQTLHVTKEHPLEQSLVSGTQTPGELLNRPIPIIKELNKALKLTAEQVFSNLPKNLPKPLLQMKNEFEFSASWSVNLKSSGYHKSHVHSKGYFSSVYYVSVPKDLDHSKRAGWLYLGRPEVDSTVELKAEKWVKPEPGKLVLFPSFMWHGTEPFKSIDNRLTVAFDILPK
ncbi:MAG: putative 2OG-Fe(II) oxygenase [Paraglaciecola sp.]|uniref:putative 2OG-Fe(II) oxygenase n=1 Tax=Paraglaciecola sp. TaxID=1920173 RepID=UPI0032976E92